MMTHEEAAWQAEALRLMAELLRYPKGQLASCVKDMARLFTDESDEQALLAALRAALDKVSNVELQVDFTALFIGSMEVLAVPYASYYVDGARQLGGPTTVAVEHLYATHGLSLVEQPRQPGDNLATMLEFVSVLVRRSLACADEGDGVSSDALQREAAEFFAAYIASWVREFACTVGRCAKTDFYRNLAALLPLVVLDDSFLLELIEEPGAGCPRFDGAASEGAAQRTLVCASEARERR